MSERGTGVGSFLLGLGIGAALGFLFAPEAGEATRTKVTRKLQGLRDLAAEKAGDLGQLLEAADDADADELPAREAVARRLADAKRRRRGGKGGGERGAAAPRPAEDGAEEDEPLA